jgi:hypothetical protein
VQYNHVEVSAEGVLSFKVHDGELTADAEDLSTVRVIYNEESGPTLECSSCRRELTEHSQGYLDDEDSRTCRDVEPLQLHTPVEAPLSWLNSAAINPDPDDNSISLLVSIGDPRGAFCMYLRKTPDGQIIMDVPHPDQNNLHMPLTPVYKDALGAYKVGS